MAGFLDELAEGICRNTKWLFDGYNFIYFTLALAGIIFLAMWNW